MAPPIANRVLRCWDLVKKCDMVLHERPVEDEEAALTILIGVRSLLEEIYSAEAHY